MNVSPNPKYQALLHSIDQAFTVLKVIGHEGGDPSDFRFVEVNEAFSRMTGLDSCIGMTIRELTPGFAPSWPDILARVARTGQSVPFEERTPSGRWFQGVAFPFGNPNERLVAQLFRDVTAQREAEAALEHIAHRYRSAADTAPSILWESDDSNRIIFLSKSWSEETGQSEEEGLGNGWIEMVHPEDREAYFSAALEAGRARVPFSLDFRARRRDGEYRWANSSGRPHYNERGEWVGYVGCVIDIHDRVMQTKQLERMEEFRRNAMEMVEESLDATNAPEFYARILDRSVRVIPGAQAGSLLLREQDGLFGFAAANGYDLASLQSIRFTEEAAGFNTRDTSQPTIVSHPVAHVSVDQAERETLAAVGRSGEIVSVLIVPIVVDEQLMAFLTLDNFDDTEAFGEPALEMARVFAAHVGSLIKRFALEEDLHRLAYEDVLTGIPSRARFNEHLEAVLPAASEEGRRLAMLFVDLDNLKPINDSLGHRAGDRVLQTVASRLSRCASHGTLLARLGGDEFSFVLQGDDVEREAKALAERVLVALEEPIGLRDREVHVGASIGISIFPDDSRTADDMLRHADIAMYHSKQNGKNSFTLFSPEMEAAPLERLLLEEALRQAIDRDEFVLHFQPRVDIASGRVVVVEALVRWNHPQRGLILPGLFIPLAESTNLIRPLGKRILELATRQARAWRDRGHRDVRVAVNLSARQLEQADLVSEVQGVLAQAGLPASALELEVLESAAMKDVEASAVRLALLKELGVTIALDDFGTGHSSLAYLQQLPLDTLKIDRSFLDRGLSGRRRERSTKSNRAVMRAITAMGREFGLRVVSEGVETEEQWKLVRAVGCDEVQGYLLSKPLPAAQVEEFLEGRNRPVAAVGVHY